VAYDALSSADPEADAKRLRNQDFHNDMAEKRRFARHAYLLNIAWILFLFAVTLLQGTRAFGFRLDEWGFRIIFVSTSASVFGFAYLVGKYLFRVDKKQ